jgi:hypothetical protein
MIHPHSEDDQSSRINIHHGSQWYQAQTVPFHFRLSHPNAVPLKKSPELRATIKMSPSSMAFPRPGPTSVQAPGGSSSLEDLSPQLCGIFLSPPPVFAIPAHLRDPNRVRTVHIRTILSSKMDPESFLARDGGNVGGEIKMR